MVGAKKDRMSFARSRRVRRLRQRWRWLPLPLRLRAAQIRGRWAHRRTLLRLVGIAILLPVVSSIALSSSTDEPRAGELVELVTIPEDHRVLSLPVDETVPPLAPGDKIDLYLSIGGFAGTSGEIDVLSDAGLVVSVEDAAFSVAILAEEVGVVAEALRDGGVLVVRR